MRNGEEKIVDSQICPFLGVSSDPETALNYPSPINHCFRARPAASVLATYQASCCLVAVHTDCKVYREALGSPLPLELKDRHPFNRPKRFGNRWWVYLIVFVFLGLIVWQGLSNDVFRFTGPGFFSSETRLTQSVVADELTPSAKTPQVDGTATSVLVLPSPSQTRTVATASPSPIAFHALETPIGIEYQLMIHWVLPGESLSLISSHFGTSPEAIQWVNYFIPTPLLVDSVIIIPIDRFDVSGLPAFEAYQVQADVSVDVLAQQLMVDPALFRAYNDLQDRQILAAGEWLLVPHLLGTATPPSN